MRPWLLLARRVARTETTLFHIPVHAHRVFTTGLNKEAEEDMEGMAEELGGNASSQAKQQQHRVGKKKGGPPKGPVAEPTILREGEADILLHGNDVFYNKAQVLSVFLSFCLSVSCLLR